MNFFGGIEAGGTKFVCMVGSGPNDIRAQVRIPTTSPAETIGRVTAFFKQQAQALALSAIGVASFGPVDLDSDLADFRLHYHHPQAGLGEHRYSRRIEGRTEHPGDI